MIEQIKEFFQRLLCRHDFEYIDCAVEYDFLECSKCLVCVVQKGGIGS